MTYHHILVIADARNLASAAVRRGAQLAYRTDARLTLALFEHDAEVERAAARGAGPIESFLVQRRQWLEERPRAFLDPAIRVQFDAAWAPAPLETILATVLHSEVDLVVKDLEQVPALKRLVATPLDWQLLRTLPVPLMLVRPTTVLLPRRVLAAVDVAAAGAAESPLDGRILAAARELAECTDARLDLAHAFPHDPDHPGLLENPRLEENDVDGFSRFASAHGIPLERRHWVIGRPDQAIGRIAGLLRADVVVLGSSYRSGLQRLGLGTTSEGLVERVAHDVLLVKPEGFLATLQKHFDLENLRRHRLAAAA